MSIEIKSLSYKIQEKKILQNLNLTINPGEILTILGPNGAGKSTLIKLISGDIKPTKGSIKYESIDLEKISIQKRAEIRSVLSQNQEIIYNYTVKEIIEMGWIEEIKKETGSFTQNLEIVSKECKIEDLLERKVNSLSGGEKRRVHIARCLIQLYNNKNNESYLFLDEPTANLDLFYEKELMNLIEKKAKEGIGIVMVLHNINLAYQFSNKILLLKNGKQEGYGELNDLLTTDKLSGIYQIPIFVKEKNLIVKYKNEG